MRAVGLTGVEAYAYDVPSPCQFSVSMITRPVSREVVQKKRVTILAKDRTGAWVGEVGKRFEASGYTVHWAGIDQPVEGHESIVSLLDSENPYLGHPSQEPSFLALKQLLYENRNSRLLWVMQETNFTCNDSSYGVMQGLARALRIELHQDISILEIDRWDAAAAKALVAVYERIQTVRQSQQSDVEYEFALHDGVVQIGRSHWASLSDQLSATPMPDMPRQLKIASFGHLETLYWAPKSIKSQLDAGEVELDMQYVGLNFKVSLPPPLFFVHQIQLYS